MSRRFAHTFPIAAVSLAALLATAPVQAFEWCVHLFPFGIINGAQIARIDAEVTDTVDEAMPCPRGLTFPVEVTFFDRRGNMIGDPDDFTLMVGDGVIESADFRGDRSMPPGQRMENRATVMIGQPRELPPGPCKAEARLTLQVIDRLSMRTQYVLSEMVMMDVPIHQ